MSTPGLPATTRHAWPKLTDAINAHNVGEQQNAFRQYADLLKRQSKQTLDALEQQFRLHAGQLARHQLPPNSLLVLEQCSAKSTPLPQKLKRHPLVVYLSSVFTGMLDLRAKLKDSLEDDWEGEVRVLAYEREPARPEAPERVIQEMIDQSGIYVGLFDLRWGTTVPGAEEFSVTALEFELASQLGKPRLVFVSLEKDKREPQLERFLEEKIRPLDTGLKYGPVDFSNRQGVIDEVRRAVRSEILSKYSYNSVKGD